MNERPSVVYDVSLSETWHALHGDHKQRVMAWLSDHNVLLTDLLRVEVYSDHMKCAYYVRDEQGSIAKTDDGMPKTRTIAVRVHTPPPTPLDGR